MADRYDAIVIGVGGMGSATVAQLAERGLSVLGLERYDIPHTMGSSHGNSRIIRLVQSERPAYVPLIERAYDRWNDLENATGEQVLHRTGSVHASRPDDEAFEGALRSCQEHGFEYEVLDGAELHKRFPGYNLPEEYEAVYQPDGGFLVPEQCIVSSVQHAHANGAEIRARERVLDWEETSQGVRVQTNEGRYLGDELVITAGAWAASFAPQLENVLTPQRRVMAWFQPKKPSKFAPETFPVFTIDTDLGHYYGFPVSGVPGLKVGGGPETPTAVDPDEMSHEPTAQDEERFRRFVDEYFPDGAGPTMRLVTCIVTYSNDGDFVIDRLPNYDAVSIAAGFSGNGFKFCSVVGEILADLVTKGDSDLALDQFSVDRF
jgi:sarcosine oxidase